MSMMEKIENTRLVELAREGALGLRRVRDELNVRVHLAGMEANDAWKKVQGRLHRMEQNLERLGERAMAAPGQAEVQFHLGVLEAQERWSEVEAEVARILDEIEKVPEAAKRVVDRTRVQAHLAELDAGEDASLLARAKARLEALGTAAATESATLLDKLVGAVRQVGTRLGALEDKRG
jgi:hypothetical protein